MNIPPPSRLLKISHILMFITVLITAISVFLVYVIEEQLTIAQLILGHITIMIMPAFFKLSYVLRLISLNELGISE